MEAPSDIGIRGPKLESSVVKLLQTQVASQARMIVPRLFNQSVLEVFSYRAESGTKRLKTWVDTRTHAHESVCQAHAVSVPLKSNRGQTNDCWNKVGIPNGNSSKTGSPHVMHDTNRTTDQAAQCTGVDFLVVLRSYSRR